MAFLALGFGVVAPGFTVGLLADVLHWDHARLPVALGLGLVAYALHKATSLRPVSADSIEAIPTVELIDHLVTVGTFKGAEIERKFRAPRYRVTALAKRLKEIEILVPGLGVKRLARLCWRNEREAGFAYLRPDP